MAVVLLFAVSASGASAAPPAAPPGATQSTVTAASTATETVPGFGQGTLTTSVTVSGAGRYLSDVQLVTKLFHTFPKDLRVTLTSPAGTTVQVTDGQGGGSDDVFSATRWSDAAGVPVSRTTFTNGVAKAALSPQQAFGRFLGENPNGVWQLKVTDQGADDDTGVLKGWSLDVSTLTEAPTVIHHRGTSTGAGVDLGSTPVTKTIPISGVSVGTAWKIKVHTNIFANARGTTKVRLTSPGGRTIVLVDDNFPGSGPTQSQQPYGDTTFSDDADQLVTTAIASGDTPMPSLAPVEPLSAFRGENPNGNWTLSVTDSRADSGDNLNAWSIDIGTAATLAPPAPPRLCVPATKSIESLNFGTPKLVNYHGFSEETNGWTVADLDQSSSDVGTYLHSVQVVTHVTTPAADKLRLQLVAPGGQTVWLTRDHGNTTGLPGDSPDTYDGTLFTDDASKLNLPGSVAETGFPEDGPVTPVAPVQPLSRLVGINPRGVWHLRAFDSRDSILSGDQADRAYIKGFSLKLTTFDEAPVRQKTVVESGPVTVGAAGLLINEQLTLQDAGTVLDQLEVGIDGPNIPFGSYIFLTSPQGRQITLNAAGASANGRVFPTSYLFHDLTLTDSASDSITGALSTTKGLDDPVFALSTGNPRFSPLEPLGAFRGENPNGTWKLTIISPNAENFDVDNLSLTARTGACSDRTPPTNPTLTSPSHTVGVPSADNTVTVDLAGAADADSGVAGYSYVFSGSPNPDYGSTTVNLAGSATSLTSEPLGDSSDSGWYLNLRTVDGKGNWSAPVSYGPFLIDTAVPETVILTGPTAATGNARPTFTFTSTRGDALYDCAMDLEAFAPCTSPYRPATALTAGAHIFKVRAKDPHGLGLVDTTPDTRSFTVDSTVPDTTITSGPTGITASTTPSWAFTSTKAGSTFTCQIDSAPTVACTSPYAPGALSNGNHTFSVFATDSGGAVDPTPATRSITVDAIAPDTSFTAGPADGATISSATPSFALGASESPVTFQCKVDAGAFTSCTSPFSPGPLSSGAHTVSARATDAAGNVDATPVSRAFTVDTTAPDTSFTGGPSGAYNGTQPTFTFTATEAGSTFECAVDVGVFASCTSPWTPTLTEGAHTLVVRATDAAGNVDASPASRTITVDITPPDTTLAAQPSGTTGASPTFTFSSADAGAGATFECAVDSGSYAACTSPRTIGPLSAGTHRFDVRAIDGAGNPDPTPAGRQFAVDATAPVPSFVGSLVVSNVTSRATATFTSDDPNATFECAVDSGAYAACASPWTTPSQADGIHTVKVRAIDAYGNVSASITAPFTIDTVVPDTTIDSGPTGTVATASASLGFSSTEAGVTFECNLDNEASYSTCTSPRALAALAQGAHTFRVRARDAAGNVDATPATRTWTVDTIAPDTTIDSGPTTTAGATATFAFSSDPGTTFTCSFDGAAATTCASPKSYTGLAAGTHSFTVTATDAAGNVDATPAARTFTTDLTTPVVTITAGPAANKPTNVDRPTFEFTSSKAGSTFLCSIDSDPFTPCSSGNQVPKLAAGERTFWVKAVDSLGNVSASLAQRSFTVDLLAPVTSTITAPQATSTTGGLSGVAGSSEDGSFECNVDGGDWAACDAAWVTPHLANGAHRLGVRAVDVAGNRDATPIFFDVTVAVPAPPVVTTTTTTTTVTTPTTPDVAEADAVTLVAPTAKTPSLQLKGKPVTMSRKAVRFSLRCPAGVTKCKATVKLSALGTAKKRGLTFSSYKGTLKPNATTILESALSTKSRRAVKALKSVRVRVLVTMSSATGTPATRRWDLTLPVTG